MTLMCFASDDYGRCMHETGECTAAAPDEDMDANHFRCNQRNLATSRGPMVT
jgi:hypothetical protein